MQTLFVIKVLLHGCQVTQDNVDEVLSKVQKDLIQLENSIASSIAHIISDRTEDEVWQHKHFAYLNISAVSFIDFFKFAYLFKGMLLAELCLNYAGVVKFHFIQILNLFLIFYLSFFI